MDLLEIFRSQRFGKYGNLIKNCCMKFAIPLSKYL